MATSLALVAAAGVSAQPQPRPLDTRPDTTALREAILAAEDRRAEDDAALAPIREGLKGDPQLQTLAVRALGRLERPALVPEIAALFDSPAAYVRAEAANAIGQAVLRGDAGPASAVLIARAQIEPDAYVFGVIARTLGRLPYQQESEIRAAERVMLLRKLAPASDTNMALSQTTMLAGVAHGLEALARRAVKLGSLSGEARARLRILARHGAGAGTTPPSQAGALAGVRRLAVAALVAVRESDVALLREVLRDSDEQVRRLGVLWLGVTEDMPMRDAAFREAYGDASPMVRYEALRTFARVRQTTSADRPAGIGAAAAGAPASAGTSGGGTATGSSASASAGAAAACALESTALGDAATRVQLLAIDLLGQCADGTGAIDRLTPFVSIFESGRTPATATTTPAAAAKAEWHRPAHALVSLARLAPDRARGWLAPAAKHDVWQIRMYAARAAGVLKDRATLATLAADPDDNVRHAAIEVLQAQVGHEADAQYLAALDRNHYQLLRTAARALTGTTTRKSEAATRSLAAFIRISAARRDTSRDTRVALLQTLEGMGRGASSVNAVDALQGYLTDFDPVIAARVATMLTAWTGQTHTAKPSRLPAPLLPTTRELTQMSALRVTVDMARGGTFAVRLRPDVAPTNAARFVRLVRAGYFNGLTFHRVEPNFVVQGGSPGANEYAGDGPYTRDELDLTSNVRGTIGISTRGRDTGDGQLYINLVDNVRLDHNYTVFAQITDGLSVVDDMLEGDVITRIELNER